MPGFTRKRPSSSGISGGIKRRGEGLGTGSVGNNSSGAQHAARPSYGEEHDSADNSYSEGRRSRGSSRAGGLFGGKSIISILIVVVAAFFLMNGENGFLGGLLGDGGDILSSVAGSVIGGVGSNSAEASAGSGIGELLNIFGGGYSDYSSYSNWGSGDISSSKLDTSVAPGTPAKRTQIYGDSRDMINIMVYMCGTDLESQGGAATSDLQEMLAAEVGDNINLLVYTGGCKRWNNDVVSSKVNQIYQIKNGDMYCITDNAGNASMTNPDTLSGFVKWVGANYPANRNMLIFWDHGGGSVSGYGYDEKFKNSESMSLSGIDKALKNAGMEFDFVGFDACLMATVETALMLSDYADYLIGSEEVEPGVGWYYTDWLTKLSADPSMSTLELGKMIADDFTAKAASQSYGTGTTLSLIDLAEAAHVIPDKLTAFASSTIRLIESGDSESSYKSVADARANAKEFAVSNNVDQVDLVDLADKIGTGESKELSDAVKSAVKYNVTSGSMSNAYGLAVFFPYDQVGYVDSASNIYNEIGISAKYTECIRKFAQTEVGGQVASGGSGSVIGSLLGDVGSSIIGGSSSDLLGLLGDFLSGDRSSVNGLDKNNTQFLDDDMDVEAIASYLADNSFDESKLTWQPTDEDGVYCIKLDSSQWSLINDIKLSMFYDDGEGFIDLGLDAYYQYDKAGRLLALPESSWIAINNQVVAFYQETSVEKDDKYIVTGRVPILLNGAQADMILVFSDEYPDGVVAGVRYSYDTDTTDTIAKDMAAPKAGDVIDFVADYYNYNGEFNDAFMIGDQITVDGELAISTMDISDVRMMYKLTDIYNREYWTQVMP